MGVSFGGMVAQELAIRYPERARHLLLDTLSCNRRFRRVNGQLRERSHAFIQISARELV
jgi:pimeloyl-ACP methyl ester carboxylesterase